jgi:hypothetical protein
MAKPTRSPLLGYNHNVKYKGRIYHVQTEDSGPANPHLFTHLYYEGTIVATKRHEYDRESSDDVVRGLMQGQHKAILKELRHAVHDDRLRGFFATRGQPMAIADGVGDGGSPQRADVPTEVNATMPELVAFDLDALPPPSTETPGPELIPPPPQMPAGGPGIYALRGSGEYPTLESGTGIRGPRPSEPLMPLVIFDDEPSIAVAPPRAPGPAPPSRPSRPPPPPPPSNVRSTRPPPEAITPPPVIRPPSRQYGTPPPVAVPRVRPSQVPPPAPPIRPPVHAGVAVPLRPGFIPVNPAPRAAGTPVDPVGVVVQRQVGIGSPAVARPAAGVRRRPAPPIPYVVKEGTHPTVGQPHTSTSPRPTSPLMPPAPMVAPPAPAPRTTLAPPPPEAPDTLVSGDKSLDEVILAYLSEDPPGK